MSTDTELRNAMVEITRTLVMGERSPELRIRWTTHRGGCYSVRLYENNRKKIAHGYGDTVIAALMECVDQRRGNR